MADNSILREAAAGHFDVLAARKAGYSDAEIEQYLLLASGRSPRGASKAQQTAPGEGLPPELKQDDAGRGGSGVPGAEGQGRQAQRAEGQELTPARLIP